MSVIVSVPNLNEAILQRIEYVLTALNGACFCDLSSYPRSPWRAPSRCSSVTLIAEDVPPHEWLPLVSVIGLNLKDR